MEYRYKAISDLRSAYEYCLRIKSDIPYWFDADYEIWKESFSEDTDYDGEKMFKELVTYAAVCNDSIAGFVQFGISRYMYSENGEKDYNANCGIIRNMYFEKEHACGEKLISFAEEYFKKQHAERKFAFFHAFGMTCNAGHGKLYCKAEEHIEEALLKYGYVKEHENVYYKRMLTKYDCADRNGISVSYSTVNPKGVCEFTVYTDGRYVGAGALVYLPQGGICYLKWIYIEGSEQSKGYASAALYRIFADLYSSGIRRLDTDTADGNIIAQKLYEKTGFTDMGRTRSYLMQG